MLQAIATNWPLEDAFLPVQALHCFPYGTSTRPELLPLLGAESY
jgi:hypothetical protein